MATTTVPKTAAQRPQLDNRNVHGERDAIPKLRRNPVAGTKPISGPLGSQGLRNSPVIPHARSASLLQALLLDLLLRKDLLPDGVSWLDDVDAERWAIWWLWQGKKAPDYLKPEDFFYGYHRRLFNYFRHVEVPAGDFLDIGRVITLLLLARMDEKVLDTLQTAEERRRALGSERVGWLERIDAIATGHPGFWPGGRCVQQYLPEHAFKRVWQLARRRKAHHRGQRMMALLEQATVSSRDLWEEHRAIGALLTEITGTDGKVDGW